VNSEPNVRVRFAPAPTGKLHLGSARTALFNWLFARGRQGKYILRIEDTDRSRSTVEFEKSIVEDLQWLRLGWDEGPQVGGDRGPYYQSERQPLYRSKAQLLLEKELAFHCYCSEEELEERRRAALAAGKMPKYDGRCRTLSDKEKARYILEGRKPAIRFKVAEKTIVFEDLIRGHLEFSSEVIGDFIIVRSEGNVSFNFAVVVDDGEMKISHVIRGEDHLTNTARHILLFEALGYPLPQFAHISMLFGTDGHKLSKRHGATSVGEYREMGYLPQALNNYLALLGWSPPSAGEILELDELAQAFSLERMSRSPAIFDLHKLNWLNHQHLNRMSSEDIAELAVPFLREAGYLGEKIDQEERERLARIVTAVRDGLDVVSQIVEAARIFFEPELEFGEEALEYIRSADPEIYRLFVALLEAQPQLDFESTKAVLKSLGERFKEKNIKGRALYFPIRAALTGKLAGPELFQIISILGKERTCARARDAMAKARIDT
jgi:nondiscriminating glutamyl-tRNA synthetase